MIICPYIVYITKIWNDFKRSKETPVKETKGTRLAREVRARCNNMTREERTAAIERAMAIINRK